MCYPAAGKLAAYQCPLANASIYTMKTVRELHAFGGGHFFDADTMRFFGSRVLSGLRAGRYFVTSERNPERRHAGRHAAYRYPRRYTVRRVTRRDIVHTTPPAYTVHTVDIDTVGDFQGYATARQAWAAIDALLATEAASAQEDN